MFRLGTNHILIKLKKQIYQVYIRGSSNFTKIQNHHYINDDFVEVVLMLKLFFYHLSPIIITQSTKLATTSFCNTIRTEISKGKLAGSVYLDLSKAIDTISHSMLIEKLQNYGDEGDELV